MNVRQGGNLYLTYTHPCNALQTLVTSTHDSPHSWMPTLTSTLLMDAHPHFHSTRGCPPSLPLYSWMPTLTSTLLVDAHPHFHSSVPLTHPFHYLPMYNAALCCGSEGGHPGVWAVMSGGVQCLEGIARAVYKLRRLSHIF